MKINRKKLKQMVGSVNTNAVKGGSIRGGYSVGGSSLWDSIRNIIQRDDEFNFFDNDSPSQNQVIYINYKAHNGERMSQAVTDIYLCNGQSSQDGVTLHVENVEVTDIIINGDSLAQKLSDIADALQDLDDRVTALEPQ